MPTTPLDPLEKGLPHPAPAYTPVITPQYLRGIMEAENPSLDPVVVGAVDPDDKGIMQVNDAFFAKAYEKGYGEKFDKSLEHLKFNPFVNVRVGHAHSAIQYGEVVQSYKNRNLGDFETIPIKEQQELLSLAYTDGPSGAIDFLRNDKNFDPRFPIKSLDKLASSQDKDIQKNALQLKSRLDNFRRGTQIPLEPEVTEWLSAQEQRKSQIIGKHIRDEPAVLENAMKQAGFRVIDPNVRQPPVLSIHAPESFQNTFRLPKPGEPLAPPEEPGVLGKGLEGIGEVAGSALDTVLEASGIAPEETPSAGEILSFPVDVALGIAAGRDFPETATGQEVNNELFGTRLAEDIIAEQTQLLNTLPQAQSAEEFEQQALQLAELDIEAAESVRKGDAIRSVFETSPIAGTAARQLIKGALKRTPVSPAQGTATGPSKALTVVEEPDRFSDLVLKDIDRGHNVDEVVQFSAKTDAPSDLVALGAEVDRPRFVAGESAEFGGTTPPPPPFPEGGTFALHGLAADIQPLPKQAKAGQLKPGLAQPVSGPKALAYRRTMFDAIDTMKKLGPKAEIMANAMQETMARYENMVSGLSFRTKDIYSAVWGKRTAAPVQRLFSGAKASKFYRISPHESDAVTEFLARGGLEKDPNLKKLLMGPRWKLTEKQFKKVRATAENMFTNVTGPVSAHPVIQRLSITDPVTGQKRGVGLPSMMMPQVPITDVRKSLTKGTKLEMLYRAEKKVNPKITRAQLRAQLNERISAYILHDLNIPKQPGEPLGAVADSFKVRSFPGAEQARLFDPVKVAEANGISVAEVYRKMGYEPDAIAAITSFTIGGLKRGETGRIYETIRKALPDAADEIVNNPTTAKAAEANVAFMDRTLRHFAGRGGAETLDNEIRGIIGNALGVTSATLLQGAFLSNMAQLSIVGTVAPATATMKAILRPFVRTLTRGDNQAKRAATNYITMAQEWARPDTVGGKLAQHSLRTSAFTLSEKFLRTVANRVGFEHVLNTARQIQKPNRSARHKLKWDGMAIELGYDPDELRKVLAKNDGAMPTEELHRGVETFTNMTAGRTDMRGIPLWAAHNSDTIHALLQLKKFGLTNLNTLQKTIMDAPTPMIGVERALKAAGLGASAGVVVNSLRDVVIKQISPLSQDGTIGRLEEEPAKEIARSLAMGLGNVYGMLIASANSGKEGTYEFLLGPNLSAAVDVADFTRKSLTDGEIDVRDVNIAASRRLPFFPAVGPALAHNLREDKKFDLQIERMFDRKERKPRTDRSRR